MSTEDDGLLSPEEHDRNFSTHIRQLAEEGIRLHEEGAPERAVCEVLLKTLNALEARDAELAALRAECADYKAALADKRRLAREIDVALNGEAGAAAAPSLCDVLASAVDIRAECERLKLRVMDSEGMAECTTLLRDDLISMGLIDKSVPPMFLTEAIVSLVKKERAECERLREAAAEVLKRLRGHPAYADLTEEEEIDVGGDTAELSYLARTLDAAMSEQPKAAS